MKYSLVAFVFAVAVRAQTDITCALSCLEEVMDVQECKPRHFDCVLLQCDAAVNLRKFDILHLYKSADILIPFTQRRPLPPSRTSVLPLTTRLPTEKGGRLAAEGAVTTGQQ